MQRSHQFRSFLAITLGLTSTLLLSHSPAFARLETNPNSSPMIDSPTHSANIEANLASLVTQRFRELRIPNAITDVWAKGNQLWKATLGVADLTQKTPIKLDDPLRIGSITKVLTGTAVLQLADESISLDDRVVKSISANPDEARIPERITPLLLAVKDAPVPFTGSDGRTHLVYELWMTNFTSGNTVIEKVEVLGDGGSVIETLDTATIASRLQPAGLREYNSSTMAKSTEALLFLHVILPGNAPVPRQLTHRIKARANAAPPGQGEISETGGETKVNRRDVVVVGPPLRGDRYLSADSCCDATRHTRAALPVNGRVWIAQRFAVDWEQLDDQSRIYSGPRKTLTSYTIFGKDVLAVADAKVVSVIDGLPEQTPGEFPSGLPVEEADGNSIILDLGEGRYGLYAHLQPKSIKVRPGDKVKRGQVIALVGNSGNTIAPHLHFHVMDTPSPLASNGLPYVIDTFQVTGKSPGTETFNIAEAKGTPLAIIPISPPDQVKNGMPLDQLLIAFKGK